MPVTALGPAACGNIEGFVRDALGCACPPAVFGDISLETAPAAFTGIPGARLLAIGGRLLVLLVDDAPAGLASHAINSLLRRGRDLRDAGGFNRFRLVIVAPPGCDPRGAGDSVTPVDDRVHLHTLASAQLPALLRVPAEAV
jgi:hypothetical protein